MPLTGHARRKVVLDEINLAWRVYELKKKRDQIRKDICETMALRDPVERRSAVEFLKGRVVHIDEDWRAASAQLASIRRVLAGR